jgi:Asp-tRNA(Asn)/Glu-tRNA(Gln) amidotransferase A subunit family amidase
LARVGEGEEDGGGGGAPIGLSLIGPPGSDEELLAFAVELAGVLGL